MITIYKYIHFAETFSKRRKTRTFDCMNNDGVTFLGDIAWHCGWRQYCFYPNDNMIFAMSCLVDINHFIQQLMDERKSNGEAS